MLVRRTQQMLSSLSPMTFPSSTTALFLFSGLKCQRDHFKALQSIPIIVFLKQLSRPWTCHVHPTCSSNIFILAFTIPLFYVTLGPTWNAHFSSCTFLKVHRAHVFAGFLSSFWFGALQDDAAGQACFPECCRSGAMAAGVKAVGLVTLHSEGTVLHPGL